MLVKCSCNVELEVGLMDNTIALFLDDMGHTVAIDYADTHMSGWH